MAWFSNTALAIITSMALLLIVLQSEKSDSICEDHATDKCLSLVKITP